VLVVGVRTREPPHFFSLNSEKMGIPRLPLTTHLPYPPLWPQLWDCTKNGQPCRRSSKSFKQKGEKLTQTLKHKKTMHSTIYQISTEPIAENDYLNIDRIVAGENASISYVCENSEDGRKFDIRFLLEHILPKGMFTSTDENTLTYNGGFAIWRKSHFDNIKAISAELTPANVMKWNGPIGQLKKAIINPLGVDALFVTEFYGGAGTAERSADLMDIIARLKKGDRLYIGAILGYHN
jgi:hypothetical protein